MKLNKAHEELEFLWEKEWYLENRTIKGINHTMFRGLEWNPKAVYPKEPKDFAITKKETNQKNDGVEFLKIAIRPLPYLLKKLFEILRIYIYK